MADYPNRIRELRLTRNLSQDALAAEVGCSKPQISDLELGNIQLTVAWMRRLAPSLGVKPAELLRVDDQAYLLSDFERDVIDRLRAGSPDQQQALAEISKIVIPDEARAQEATGTNQ